MNDEAEIGFSRIRYIFILSLITILNIPWWYVLTKINSAAYDPLWLRGVISLTTLTITIFFIYYKSMNIRRIEMMHFFTMTTFIYLMFFITGNSFNDKYYILSSFMVFILGSITFESKRYTVLFLLFSVAGMYGLVYPTVDDNMKTFLHLLYFSATVSILIINWDKSMLIKTIRNQLFELRSQQERSINASKLAEIGEMASSIAHEINNPLTVIRACVVKLERSHSHSKYMDKIHDSVDRIVKIIESMKMSCRHVQVTDKMKYESINQLVDSSVLMFKERLLISGIKFNVVLLEKDIKVLCYSSEISQVLINMINNARDSIIESKEPWINISLLKVENSVLMRIQDSGIISEDALPKIFNTFFTTKEPGKGTGLGLSIVANIIKNHGGEISAKNDPTTTFEIVFKKVEQVNEINKAA